MPSPTQLSPNDERWIAYSPAWLEAIRTVYPECRPDEEVWLTREERELAAMHYSISVRYSVRDSYDMPFEDIDTVRKVARSVCVIRKPRPISLPE